MVGSGLGGFERRIEVFGKIPKNIIFFGGGGSGPWGGWGVRVGGSGLM